MGNVIRNRRWSKKEVAQVTHLEASLSNMEVLVSALKEVRDGWRPVAGATKEDTSALLERIGAKITDDEELTFRCLDCRDIGYRLRDDELGWCWSAPCSCEKGKALRMGVTQAEAWSIGKGIRAQERALRAAKKVKDDELPF